MNYCYLGKKIHNRFIDLLDIIIYYHNMDNYILNYYAM